MGKKKGRQLNVTVVGCTGLKENSEGPPHKRKCQVQLEVEDMEATTKFVDGGLDPVWNEGFSVIVTSAAAPDLYVQVVHNADPENPESKVEFLGHVKINLGLLEDRPMRDMKYQLEKKAYNQTVSGDVNLKIEYTSQVDIDESDVVAFKRNANSNRKKGGVLEFFMKEIDKLRVIETNLEERVEKAEPQVKELSKKIERREEMMTKLEKGGDVLSDLKKLEEDRKALQQMYREMQETVEDRDKEIRRKDKQIMQLEMMAKQNQRVARVQMTPRQPSSTPAAGDGEGDDANVPGESAALTGMGALGQLEDREASDDEESVDDDDFDEDDLGDEDEEDTSTAGKRARLWKKKFEKEKEAKLDWKDKCYELEGLYNGMLMNKQKADEEKNAAQNMEEIETLREENDELKMVVKLTESQLEEAMKKYKKEAKERKKLYNEIQELKGNIRVYCRCRPISKHELERGAADCTSFGELDDITIFSEQGPKRFEFDSTFDQDSTQEMVFQDTQPLMQSVLDGFNVCIFAYGQTGSGKTYTMQGPKENGGVNVRALMELFRLVADKGQDYVFEMSISILEIYCDKIRDLLIANSADLPVRQEKRGNRTHNYVEGLSQQVVNSVDDVDRVIDLANKHRSTASTNMNEYSSRSHLVMTVDCATIDKLSGKKTQSALHMIDLAGSERVGRSGVTGQAMKEAQSINQSLSALGNVLAALGSKNSHVPYRNSKLTHCLADALGGNSKVLMFCNVSPSSDNVSETLSSLQFATRARAVELGKATANVGKDAEVPAELQDEEEKPAAKGAKAPAAAAKAGARGAKPAAGRKPAASPAAAKKPAASPAARGRGAAARGATRGAARGAARGRK